MGNKHTQPIPQEVRDSLSYDIFTTDANLESRVGQAINFYAHGEEMLFSPIDLLGSAIAMQVKHRRANTENFHTTAEIFNATYISPGETT